MRYAIITVLGVFAASGCSATTSQALRGEIGRSVAHAQLVAGFQTRIMTFRMGAVLFDGISGRFRPKEDRVASTRHMLS